MPSPEFPHIGDSEVQRRVEAIDTVEHLAEPTEPERPVVPTPRISSEHLDEWATEEIEWGTPRATHGDGVL